MEYQPDLYGVEIQSLACISIGNSECKITPGVVTSLVGLYWSTFRAGRWYHLPSQLHHKHHKPKIHSRSFACLVEIETASNCTRSREQKTISWSIIGQNLGRMSGMQGPMANLAWHVRGITNIDLAWST